MATASPGKATRHIVVLFGRTHVRVRPPCPRRVASRGIVPGNDSLPVGTNDATAVGPILPKAEQPVAARHQVASSERTFPFRGCEVRPRRLRWLVEAAYCVHVSSTSRRARLDQ